MSEIIQNISDIFSITSLVFSICCGKFFTMQKKYFFARSLFFITTLPSRFSADMLRRMPYPLKYIPCIFMPHFNIKTKTPI